MRFLPDLIGRRCFKYQPRWFEWLLKISTWEASRKLVAAGVNRVLVDNTVLSHGVTHETAWVSTGKADWGGHEIDTGYAARISKHDEKDRSDAARSVRYLPGIVSLAQRKSISLAISSELRDEQLTQPSGRFKGYGCFDLSLFSGIAFETIEDVEYSVVISGASDSPSVREQRSRRLAAKADPLYPQLLSVLGERNSQDVWHIVTAERNDCYCFLTMDFSLIRNVRAQSKNKVIKSLRTRVLSPEEFGREFSIVPISPTLFSHH